METAHCQWCGEYFWSDDPEQGKCLSCSEGPAQEASREKAVEQWLDYMQSRNKPVETNNR